MGFFPHLAEVERLNSKFGQSETSSSKKTFPGEMGHFVPLDKTSLVPSPGAACATQLLSELTRWIFSLLLQTQALMHYRKQSCQQPCAAAAMAHHLCSRGSGSRATATSSSWKRIFFPGHVSNWWFTLCIFPFGKTRFGTDTTKAIWNQI